MKYMVILLLAFNGSTTLFAQSRSQQQSAPAAPSNLPSASAEPMSYFVSGKVRTDDDTPLPQHALIQSICQNQRHVEGYTDSKGHFNFELGIQSAVGQDISSDVGPSVPGATTGKTDVPAMHSPGGGPSPEGVSNRNLRECQIQAVLPGYISTLVNMPNGTWGAVDVGTIVLHRAGGPSGGSFLSATTAAAPSDAKKLYEKGREAASKKKWDDAQQKLEKAVQVYPQFAVAWVELARVQVQKKDVPGAQKSLSQALQADSKLISPYHELAAIAYDRQQWQQVADNVSHEMQLDPQAYPEDWFYSAASNYYLYNFDAAEKSVRAGLRADPQHKFPKMEYLLGVTLVQQRNFSEALTHMRNYVQLAPTASDIPKVKEQIAQIEQVAAQSGGGQQQANTQSPTNAAPAAKQQ